MTRWQGSIGQQLFRPIENSSKSVAKLLGLIDDKPPAKLTSQPKNGDEIPSEIADIKQQISDIRDGMHDMRADLDQFGKTVGTIATGVLGAIGYTQIHSFFPFPVTAPGWLGPATIAAAVCGIGASAFLVFRFFFAKRRILVEPPAATRVPDTRGWHRLNPWHGERRILDRDAVRYAQREGIASLRKVEEEAVKLAREAREETDETEAKRKWARAYRLEKIVDLALWDAASDILERRTRGAFGGPLATIGVVLAVGGIGFVFATADWVKGERDRTAPAPAQAAVTCVAQIRDKNLAPALSKQLYAACAKLIKP